MGKFKTLGVIAVYFFAFWHGYVLLARPLIFHDFALPFSSQVKHYSGVLLVDQAWAYFYKPLATNSEVHYSVNGSGQMQKFFGSSPSYLQQRRFYRCISCAHAAYQLQDGTKSPEGGWLIGHYLCAFHSATDHLKVEVRTALYNSSDFRTVVAQEIACSSYQ
jgi:hypothetical protein